MTPDALRRRREACWLDVELLKRAAANIETLAAEQYDRCCLNTRGRLDARGYERYARLHRIAQDILSLVEDSKRGYLR